MATTAKTLSRSVPAPQTESEAFKTIVMLCAAGLFVSVLLASYGVDLSPGFFCWKLRGGLRPLSARNLHRSASSQLHWLVLRCSAPGCWLSCSFDPEHRKTRQCGLAA